MKKVLIMILAVLVLLVGSLLAASNKGKETKEVIEQKPPTVVVANGFFAGSLVNDGNGRSVLVVNTQTGDFEVFDIDRQAMDRKEMNNEVYYSSIKYNHQDGTRQLLKYRVVNDSKAGVNQE
ncbi:MAG: hypothetical protein WCJ94_01275 [bacterium]